MYDRRRRQMRSMPSDRERDALEHILHNIAAANSFVKGHSFATFKDNLLVFYATTRALEIISEASRRLSEDLKDRNADFPCQQIAASGNVYRHEYEDVRERIIWSTVQDFLPSLREIVLVELTK